MKRIITLISIFAFTTITFSQNIFVYNQSGLKPNYVVENIDSLNQNELYNKTINWIKETYKNPDEVIKTTIENEKIRFEGFQPKMFTWSRMMAKYKVGLFYTIEISFKDGRYKLEPIEIKSEFQPKGCYEPGPGRYITIDLSNGSQLYKRNGKLKCSNNLPESFSDFLNSLNTNLQIYLSKQTLNKDEEW
jgi:hypothetical protein